MGSEGIIIVQYTLLGFFEVLAEPPLVMLGFRAYKVGRFLSFLLFFGSNFSLSMWYCYLFLILKIIKKIKSDRTKYKWVLNIKGKFF